MTDREVELLQNTQLIDNRAAIYMNAASLRLDTALARAAGREAKPGDALEFYSQEEMLDDYYRILERVMLIVGDAFDAPRRRENIDIKKALRTLKAKTADQNKKLTELRQWAETKQKEELWNRVNRALDINYGVRDGAEDGLAIIAARDKAKANNRN